MRIRTIDIRDFSASSLVTAEDRLFHQKCLPVMSVVQATEGSYGIKIGDSPQFETGKMGVFIAPADRMQYITHRTDAQTGKMRAHWVFFTAVINECYRLEEVFDFPVILPPEHQNAVYEIIGKIHNNENVCDVLSGLYKLIVILTSIGTPREPQDENAFVYSARRQTERHYTEDDFDGKRLAEALSVSPSTLYRNFQKFFNTTPSRYINDIRLNKAALLLENTNLPLYAVGEKVGFSDAFYFSRLFRQKFSVPPSIYKKYYKNEVI